MNLSPGLRGKIARYKAKRTALEILRQNAHDARDESELLDRELASAESDVARIRTDLLEQLEQLALADS